VTTLDPSPLAPAGAALPEAAALGDRLVAAICRTIVGKDAEVANAVAAVLAGGHVLVDDVPGVGQTPLAQTLAAAVGGSFRRVQGTPDLLPSDVLGSVVPDDAVGQRLRFRPGPVFANVVVFDEINRTSPRTQAALLEAAEERTVTVDGRTHALPAPFVLIATENPVEMAGTYALGEGALDRFSCTLELGRADAVAEREVLLGRGGRAHLADVRPVADTTSLAAAQAAVSSVVVAEPLADYVVRLLHATRERPGVRLGVSTRGGMALVQLARARATMAGRSYVTPDAVPHFAPASVAHPIVLDPPGPLAQARALVAELVATVPVPRG
jgi:MoxR-like ATPase